MDKWKPSELEKMKVGGNKKLNEFLEEHDDYNEQWTIGKDSYKEISMIPLIFFYFSGSTYCLC